MTLDTFAGVLTARIPTPAEFVAFARDQGWELWTDGTRAALRRANPSDPVAVATAKMLGREPYRTNVLAELVRAMPPADLPDDPRPDVIAEPPAGEPAPTAVSSPTDPYGWFVLRAGASYPAMAAELVGPEHGTHALIAARVTPADLIPWEEVKAPDRRGTPKNLPPSFKLTLPRITARLGRTRFSELFPAA